MSFGPGELVGPYRILEQLGQGGMATVHKAYHAALDRFVALKVLHPAFNEDPNFLARFQREARVVAKLEHAHIVPVYDYAEHGGRPYLVMKFIDGKTLKARIAEGSLSAGELDRVVEAVGSALTHAHRQGVLHRDIKPSNLMIGTDGEMYLADFGLARIAQAGESTMSSDSIMGTPQYISPEQAMGKKDLDEGTDIYSFGVLLYELVVGQVPFTADTPYSVIHDHIYTPLPLPRVVNPSVPEPVEQVLLQALAKDRRDRYATVDQLTRAFREAWIAAGVPMRSIGIPIAASTLTRSANRTETRRGRPAAATVEAARRGASRSVPWAYVLTGGSLLIVGLILFSALAAGGLLSIAEPQIPEPPATAAELPQVPAATAGLPSGSTPPTALAAPPAVATARALVEQDPSDSVAHLALARALWTANQPRAAFETLTQAANLAGPTNRDFFLRAALDFRSLGAWTAAGAMYLRAVQTYPVGAAPHDLMQQLNEAVYRAAEQPDMPLFLFFERIDQASQPLGFIARSRHALYNGAVSDAKMNLELARRLKPELLEAFLLESEIALREGRLVDAEPVLISLSGDLGAPAWVREFASELLASLP